MIECEVEAGIFCMMDLAWDQETKDVNFPGDKRVIRFTVGPRPGSVQDLRINYWITVVFGVEEEHRGKISFIARELVERIVDALSVLAGIEVQIIHWQVVRPQIARPTSIHGGKPRKVDLVAFSQLDLSERHYRAIRHIRRGLAQSSPERRFASLMLAVSILARSWKPDVEKIAKCPQCNATVSTHGPGERDHLRNLTKVLGGWTEQQIDKLWNLRNAVIGHGNEHLTPNMGLELLEASFDAARLAYDALNASLPGAKLEGPNPLWFITDVFLLEDSAIGAHKGVADVLVKRGEGNQWTVTVPTVEPKSFSNEDPFAALRAAKQYLESSMKRHVHASSVPPEIVRIPIEI